MCQEGYLKAFGVGKGTKYELNIASKVSENVASKVSENVASSNVLNTKNRNKRTERLYAEIMAVCVDYQPLNAIAPRVNRSLRYLKNSVIPEMVAAGLLIRKFPDIPSHPDQQYKSGRKE